MDANRATAAVAPATLLGADSEAVEHVLSGQAAGPLAVCSAPFAGRDRVLAHAADRLGTDHLRLGPDADAAFVEAALGDGPVVIDGWHHLYERRIAGFDPLTTALRAVAEAEAQVVTGWNSYAWAYLVHARDIARTFATRAEIEPMGAATLATLILDHTAESPTFAVDQAATDGLVTIRRAEMDWRGHTLTLPVPVLNRASLTALLTADDTDPQDAVFERLATVSRGNLGVAMALWNATPGAEIRPSDIVAAGADSDRELDRAEAFCLRIVLLHEHVTRAAVGRIIDEPARVLGRLRRDGFVSTADGVVHLEPAAVPTAITETERRGLH